MIHTSNENLEHCLNSQKVELHQIKKERDAIEFENGERKEVNEDLTVLNERLAYIVPRTLEEENLELRESIAILKCHLELYKNSEDTEQADENLETVDEEMENACVILYCDFCPFETFSQKGLHIHIGKKHKTENPNK